MDFSWPEAYGYRRYWYTKNDGGGARWLYFVSRFLFFLLFRLCSLHIFKYSFRPIKKNCLKDLTTLCVLRLAFVKMVSFEDQWVQLFSADLNHFMH